MLKSQDTNGKSKGAKEYLDVGRCLVREKKKKNRKERGNSVALSLSLLIVCYFVN